MLIQPGRIFAPGAMFGLTTRESGRLVDKAGNCIYTPGIWATFIRTPPLISSPFWIARAIPAAVVDRFYKEIGGTDKDMNNVIAYDTHKFVKHLMESGFSEQQAEGLVSGQVHLLNDNLATRTDLKVLRAGMDLMKVELKTEIGRLESRMVWMMLVQSVAIIGLVVTLIKL